MSDRKLQILLPGAVILGGVLGGVTFYAGEDGVVHALRKYKTIFVGSGVIIGATMGVFIGNTLFRLGLW